MSRRTNLRVLRIGITQTWDDIVCNSLVESDIYSVQYFLRLWVTGYCYRYRLDLIALDFRFFEQTINIDVVFLNRFLKKRKKFFSAGKLLPIFFLNLRRLLVFSERIRVYYFQKVKFFYVLYQRIKTIFYRLYVVNLKNVIKKKKISINFLFLQRFRLFFFYLLKLRYIILRFRFYKGKILKLFFARIKKVYPKLALLSFNKYLSINSNVLKFRKYKSKIRYKRTRKKKSFNRFETPRVVKTFYGKNNVLKQKKVRKLEKKVIYRFVYSSFYFLKSKRRLKKKISKNLRRFGKVKKHFFKKFFLRGRIRRFLFIYRGNLHFSFLKVKEHFTLKKNFSYGAFLTYSNRGKLKKSKKFFFLDSLLKYYYIKKYYNVCRNTLKSLRSRTRSRFNFKLLKNKVKILAGLIKPHRDVTYKRFRLIKKRLVFRGFNFLFLKIWKVSLERMLLRFVKNKYKICVNILNFRNYTYFGNIKLDVNYFAKAGPLLKYQKYQKNNFFDGLFSVVATYQFLKGHFITNYLVYLLQSTHKHKTVCYFIFDLINFLHIFYSTVYAVKILISGRFTAADKRSSITFQTVSKLYSQTISIPLIYQFAEAYTYCGVFGIKFWLSYKLKGVEYVNELDAISKKNEIFKII